MSLLVLCIIVATATNEHEDRMYKIAQRGEEQRETAEIQRYLIITFGSLSFLVALYNLYKAKKKNSTTKAQMPLDPVYEVTYFSKT